MKLNQIIKNTYTTMQETIPTLKDVKNYFLATTLVVGMAYSVSGQEIYNSTKQEIRNYHQRELRMKVNKLKQNYESQIYSSTILLNNAIKDGMLTVSEQELILKHYDVARSAKEKYNQLAKRNDLEQITDNNEYFELMRDNVEGWILFKDMMKLESKFETEQNVYVDIAPNDNFKQNTFGTVVLGLILLGGAEIREWYKNL